MNTFFFLVIPILITLFLNHKTEFVTWNEWLIYSVIYSIFAGVMIWFSYKNYQLFVSNHFIIKENGAWDIDTTIIEPYKIQAIETQQFFWQKLTNILRWTKTKLGAEDNIDSSGGKISYSQSVQL